MAMVLQACDRPMGIGGECPTIGQSGQLALHLLHTPAI